MVNEVNTRRYGNPFSLINLLSYIKLIKNLKSEKFLNFEVFIYSYGVNTAIDEDSSTCCGSFNNERFDDSILVRRSGNICKRAHTWRIIKLIGNRFNKIIDLKTAIQKK